jgi:small subunit ribosomal protein S16
MSVVIRLARAGAKKAAFFRVVVADSRKKRDGRLIEQIGTYDPRQEEGVSLKPERVQHWLAQGARPSLAVRSLLRRAGIAPAGRGRPEGAAAAVEVTAPAE